MYIIYIYVYVCVHIYIYTHMYMYMEDSVKHPLLLQTKHFGIFESHPRQSLGAPVLEKFRDFLAKPCWMTPDIANKDAKPVFPVIPS